MEPTHSWSQFFQNWPAGLPNRGLLQTTLNDLVPFKSFMIADSMLLLERTTPDPMNARYVLLSFDCVASVKLLDSVQEATFTAAGFCGKLSQR